MSQQFPYAANDDAPPLDLEFLTRQTQGNRLLQRELFSLFRDQLLETRESLTTGTEDERSESSHALRGAALNLGAFVLAEELRKLEETVDTSSANVELAIDRVLQFIEKRFE